MFALAAMPPVPADPHALADFPTFDTRAHGIDHTRNFMPWHARKLQAWPHAFLGQNVAVADAASLNLDEHMAFTRLGHLALDEFERGSRLPDFDRFHFAHGVLPSW